MHVVVVGCGRVGSGLAATLEARVTPCAVVDRKRNRLPSTARGLLGRDRSWAWASTATACIAAGIERAGALAVVTNGDNSNILVARVAREAFGIERVVARIYDQRRAAIYERLGISTVATVGWATERVLRRIEPDADGVEWIDPSAKVCLVERVGAHRLGRPAARRASRATASPASPALTRLGVARSPDPQPPRPGGRRGVGRRRR